MKKSLNKSFTNTLKLLLCKYNFKITFDIFGVIEKGWVLSKKSVILNYTTKNKFEFQYRQYNCCNKSI